MGLFDLFGRKDKKGKRKEEFNLTEGKTSTAKTLGDLFQPRIDGNILENVYNHNIKDGVFVIPKNIVSIESCAFNACDNLETLVLHDGIKFIAPNAFHKCKNLKQVIGLSSLTKMNNFGGFSECVKLDRLVLPETIKVICDSALYGCVGLQSIVIPPSCMMISKQAFANCAGLKYLEIPSTISFIQEDAFKNCDNLTLMFSDELVDYEDNKNSRLVRNSFDLQIAKDALRDVKIVCAHDIKIIEKVIESGYRGVVSYFDDEKEQTVTVNLGFIDDVYGEYIRDQRDIQKQVSEIENRYYEKHGEPSVEELEEEERLLKDYEEFSDGEDEPSKN